MSQQTWFLPIIILCAFCLLQSTAIAQQEPVTADQVLSRYVEAIGAERLSAVNTFMETGDLDGNVTNFWQGYRSPAQAQKRQHATFDTYFKRPNFRFSSSLTDNNQVIAFHGCDGKVAWYIDSSFKRTEFKPKPDSKGDCEEGFQAPYLRLRQPDTKMRLVKKKEVEGRMAWEIKVNVSKSPFTQTYYFDAETFLLLRLEHGESSVSFSDYRDVGGIKLPFTAIQEFTNSKLITTVREVKINAPIDDAIFVEPRIIGGKIELHPYVNIKKETNDAAGTGSAPPVAMNAEPSKTGPPESAAANTLSVVEVNFPNFTSCAIEQLQQAVPELKGLKPSATQEKLPAILEKVGAKISVIARDTPNLISRESVTELSGARDKIHHDYDYLILARVKGTMVGLDEFRLDLKSGEKFQTDELMDKESSFRDDLERASNELGASNNRRPALSQGFAASWVHFYPSNRSQATYRYLGEQKRDGHSTLVLAFAEKPASVIVPAIFRAPDKAIPMYLQGIAWVDPSDFRIMRLRTDLLAPVPEVSLHRLTADIQFALTRVEQVPSPLPLPREVKITATVAGATVREIHEYSDYRLFRAQSRLVLNP